MNRPLYSLLFYLAMPLVLLRLCWRSVEAPAYRRRWLERLAVYGTDMPRLTQQSVVFHAVSVGEVHAAVPLIRAWQTTHPEQPVVVTSSTPTGSARVREIFADSVIHVYLPYDLPGAVRRFLKRFRPQMLVVLETELWPNLIYYCDRQGVSLLLANARLSARSQKGYAKIGKLSQAMLSRLTAVAAQSAADAERLCALGLARERVTVTGSLKFDLELDESQQAAGKALRTHCFGGRPVLIAASTREGEDDKVLRAYRLMRDACPQLGLVLVPRHPERFTTSAALFRAAGFRVQSRSQLSDAQQLENMDVLVGDTMGEMQGYYAMADIAFVGGSLVDTGCQNILEPAALGLPVITGPSLYNFAAISDVLREVGAQQVVQDEAQLAGAVLALLDDPVKRQAMATAAEATVAGSRGATRRVLSMMSRIVKRPNGTEKIS